MKFHALVAMSLLATSFVLVAQVADTEFSDVEEDGFPLSSERNYGTDPLAWDTDLDGVSDGEDGWATEPALAPPRLPDPF